jgi:prepilin peptidase CpaA
MPDRLVLWGVLSIALLVSVITDLTSRRIPDFITWPTALLALAFRLWRGGVGDLDTGFLSGLIAASGAGGLLALWAFRGKIGWGDVKLLFAVGAVFGYPLITGALIFISLCGALQAVVTLIWKGSVWSTTRRVLVTFGKRLKLTKGETSQEEPHYIPYGVAIALGSFWAMWWEQSNP